MPSIEQYMTAEACAKVRDAIRDASGNEVFFVGRPQDDGKIHEVRVVCRGGPRAVMVLFSVPQFGDVVIHNHPSGLLLPSRADEEIAGRFDGKGVGFFIVDNEATDIYALVEPFREEAPTQDLDEDEVAALLGPDGPLAAELEGYEERLEQQQMLRHIVRAFNREQLLMVEAGTGTGKSLSYLLPAVMWARRNRQRVVISTNTINLQQQLCEKDIPFLQRVLPEPFRAVLVKGRQNYMCLRKLHQKAAESQLELEQNEDDMHMLLQWAQQTATGDRADLSHLPQETLWTSIAAESDTCQRNRCEYYRSCFYYIARRKHASADILVTNHHIFFADLALRYATDNYHGAALLPPYDRVILDEAHNIEDAASSFLGSRVTRIGVLRALGMLLKGGSGKKEGGLLLQLADALFKHQQRVAQADELRQQIFEVLLPTVRRQRQRTLWFCERLHHELVDVSHSNTPATSKIRITESLIQRGPWQSLQGFGLDWADELRGLVHEVTRLLHKLEGATSRQARHFAGYLMDMEGAASRLGGAAATLDLFFRNGCDDPEEEVNRYVRWFELKNKEPGNIRLMMAPLEIGEAMQRMLYDRIGSVAFTSATLATSESDFSYISGRLGLDRAPEERVQHAQYPSPFDYSSQSLVGIPTDIPHPRDPAFEAVISGLIYQAIEASGGRAFVLCTSFSLMDALYKNLAGPLLEQLGLRSLRQGEAPRNALLQQKLRDPRSVLFGTDSFWEGVDVRGEALTNVILTRLPFRVPSEPLIEARHEAIEASGQNPFLCYTVPAATIKFKQGFGRLIRSREDRGTVLILDKRVVEKSYGKRFLYALPPDCPRIITSKDRIIEAFAQFHQERKYPF